MHVSSALYQLDICEDHASFYDFKTSRYSIKKVLLYFTGPMFAFIT